MEELKFLTWLNLVMNMRDFSKMPN
jgi:hypothetical protein